MPEEEQSARARSTEPAGGGGRQRLRVLAVGAGLVALVGGGVWLQSVRSASDEPQDIADIPSAVEETGIAFGTKGPRVEIFVDYQCGHCADLDLVIGAELESLLSSDDAQLLLRPVSYVNPWSGKGAAALRCAADSRAGLVMHDALLARMGEGEVTNDGLTSLAGTLGIDETEFGACLSDKATRTWVRHVNASANDDGMSALPSVYVDGSRLSDSQLASGAALREAVVPADD